MIVGVGWTVGGALISSKVDSATAEEYIGVQADDTTAKKTNHVIPLVFTILSPVYNLYSLNHTSFIVTINKIYFPLYKNRYSFHLRCMHFLKNHLK